MQTDGNFVVYSNGGAHALWNSGTNGTNSERLQMEDDGRIIIYKSQWNSGTVQSPNAQTLTHPTCDIGFSRGWGDTISTGSCLVSPSGLYELLLQTDGNLVLYNLAVTPAQSLWSTNTALTPFSPGITFATTYTYDVLGNLTAVSQAAGPVNGVQTAGQARSYVYDSLGRVTSVTTPESGIVTTYYTTSGGATCSGDTSLACRLQDARGVVRTFTYDGINRPTGVTYSDGTPSVTYQYDAGGAAAFALDRLTKIMEGPTNSQTFTYDNFGRITNVSNVVDSTTYPVQYAYNLAGQLSSITYPTGRAVAQNVDAIGRLSSVADGSTTYLSGLSYNAAGEALALSMGNGVQGSFGYNDHLQTSTLRYFKGSTDILNLAYDYTTGVPGNNGQIQAVHYYTSPGVEDLTKSENFTYDSLDRLSAAHTTTVDSTAGTWSLQWQYDRLGNRLSQTLVGGNVTIGQPNFTIDPATNRITNSGYTYDAAGNMTHDASNAYTYDGANRLTKINAGPPTYTYFGALRIKKIAGSTTTVYIYSGSKPIVEYVNGSLSKEYIYAGSKLLATIAGSSTTYHHPDHLSNRAETDASGTRTRTFGQFPFGETWYEPTGTDKFKFTSYENDSGTGETGLNYAQFRYHAPGQGRFMSADLLAGSLGAPQSLNRYSYAMNDPVNLIDPLGLYCTYYTETEYGLDHQVTGVTQSYECTPDLNWEAGFDTDLMGGWGGGGGPFGGGPAGTFPEIVKRALQALSNPDCAAAVGHGYLPEGGDLSAADVLTDLASNVVAPENANSRDWPPSHFGTVTFDAMSSPPGTVISAGTTGGGSADHMLGSIRVVSMTINTAAGNFVTGSLDVQAATLLHELGHAMSFLFGSDFSAIKKDDPLTQAGRDQSKANQKTIEDKCIKKKK